jgi:acetyl-CoA carboxylase biotin carboxyl carrier protein
MDLDHLQQILALVRQHDLAEFEIEQDGLKLRVRRGGVAPAAPAAAPAPLPVSMPATGLATVVPAAPAAAPVASVPPTDAELELAVVKSPIVGTFYRSAEPDSPPFVDIGTIVKKGQVLCIIEAMKLMNEIDSEYDGEITNIYIENGQPVQYGERLFAIRTK